FQAEDGIRDRNVTGVQTCALPIWLLFMVVFSAVMGAAVLLTKSIFGFFLPFEENRIAATLMLMIGVVVGAVVYLFLAYKSTLLESVLGDTSILNRLKRKKRS